MKKKKNKETYSKEETEENKRQSGEEPGVIAPIRRWTQVNGRKMSNREKMKKKNYGEKIHLTGIVKK